MAVQTLPAQQVKPENQSTRWVFTFADYERIHEIGLFQDIHVELIDGDVLHREPISTRHAATVNRLSAILVPFVDDIAIVSVQNAMFLNDYSVPQRDLALFKYVRISTGRYDQPLPTFCSLSK